MQYFGLFGARRAVAVVCLPLAVACIPFAVACGSSSSDSGSDAPPEPSTMGAQLPSGGSKGMPEIVDPGLNPERNPHLWRKHDAGSSTPPAPTTTATTPPAPTATTPPAPTPTTPPAPTATTPPPPAPRPLPFRGVNLSGAEFGSAIPGSFGTDYTFPTHAEIDYYTGKGMTAFRVPFRWERLQPSAYGALDTSYLGRLDDVVTYATSKGASVILNPQNFARYYGATIGSSSVPNAVFADFWGKVAAKYASNARVMFNLVNEPHDMPTEQWVSAANAAIASIRGAGATNVIIVPGNGWTGGASWYSSDYGTPNAVALLNVTDPGNNVLFEAHQYFDSDASGTTDVCMTSTIGSTRLTPFVKWLRDNGKKGFLGEFAGANNSTCVAAVKDMLDFVNASADVLMGWQWWGGGPWWGNYMFALDPSGTIDQPQMTLIAPYLL